MKRLAARRGGPLTINKVVEFDSHRGVTWNADFTELEPVSEMNIQDIPWMIGNSVRIQDLQAKAAYFYSARAQAEGLLYSAGAGRRPTLQATREARLDAARPLSPDSLLER